MRSHAGQVALPGGRRDPTDATLEAAALREADEEIGLPARSVQVLGVGDALWTPSGYVITPVVGLVGGGFEPTPNPAEVARVFSAPLGLFRERGAFRLLPERARRLLRAYPVDGEVVWGATAAMLCGLTRRLGEVESSEGA